MTRALALGGLLAEHALHVFDLMGADEVLDHARKVWGWITK